MGSSLPQTTSATAWIRFRSSSVKIVSVRRKLGSSSTFAAMTGLLLLGRRAPCWQHRWPVRCIDSKVAHAQGHGLYVSETSSIGSTQVDRQAGGSDFSA